MKKLPQIYKNKINKKINNNKEYCYLKNNTSEDIEYIITEKLNSIFHGVGYPYNKTVEIITKDKTYQTSLLTRTKNSVITINDETIPIKDIITLNLK